MAKNEAKIRFTAETGDFNKNIKKANDEMAKLRAEAKLNAEQMKDTGETVESLQKKQENLTKQFEATKAKTEAMSQKVEAAKRIFGENSAEVKKLETQLLSQQTAQVKLERAVENCKNEIKAQREEESRTRTETERLTSTIEEQQKEVDKLKEEYIDAVLQYGKNSDEAKDLAKELGKLTSELKENKDKMDDAEKSADSFEGSLEETGKTSESVTAKFDATALGVLAIGAAAIEAGKQCIEAFNDLDEGADNLIRATGATGATAEELTEIYKNVSKKVVGSLDEIGATVGEVNTRFGYTGKELEDCSTDFMKFSEVTGVNSTDAVKMVTRALNDAQIPLDQYGDLLDYLAKAGQVAGIDINTLADSLSKNGAIMRGMGFDTEETIALLSQFELSGADATTMLSGMKKAMGEWTKEGKDSKEEFAKLVSGIKDGSITAGEAVEILGGKAGPQLVDAIKSGKFEYEDMLEVIEDSRGTMDKTFNELEDGGYKTELAFQNLKVQAGELGEEILEHAGPAFEELIEGFEKTDTMKKTGELIGKLAKTVLPPLAKALEFIVENFETLVTVVGGAYVAFKSFQAVMAVTTAINAARTAVTALSPAVSAVTKVQYGWNAAMSANPIGAVITAVALLVTTIGLLTDALIEDAYSMEDAMEAASTMTEEQEQLMESAQETTQAFKDQREQLDKDMAGIQSEAEYMRGLVEELDTLTDAKGRVKDADQQRADFILNQLNEAYGTEYEMVDGVIKKYDEFKEKINEVITVQTAQAMMETETQAYAEAKKKRAEAQAFAQQAQINYENQINSSNKRIMDLEKEKATLEEDLDWKSGAFKIWVTRKKIATIEENIQAERDAVNKTKETYDQSIQNLADVNVTIDSYEKAQIAMQEENYEEVIRILESKSTAQFEYAADVDAATKQTIEKLYEEAIEAGKAAEEAKYNFEHGIGNFTEEMVIEAQEGYESALSKWAKAYDDAHEVGTDLGGGIKAGMEGSEGALIARARTLINSIVATMKNAAAINSPSKKTMLTGEGLGEGVEVGIENTNDDVLKSAQKQVDDVVKVYEGINGVVDPIGNLNGFKGHTGYNVQQRANTTAVDAVEQRAFGNGLYAYVQAVEDLANRAIELNINGQRFATATAADTDKVNGNRMVLSKMGLALA